MAGSGLGVLQVTVTQVDPSKVVFLGRKLDLPLDRLLPRLVSGCMPAEARPFVLPSRRGGLGLGVGKRSGPALGLGSMYSPSMRDSTSTGGS
jgi:hypothetical protein